MYIYHLIPEPFHGTSLIPLNQMDLSSDLYKNHAHKYKGREELMDTLIPTMNCKWNDVIHFSSIDPKIIAREIRNIKPDLKLRRSRYFKIHIDQIINKYRAVIFKNNPKDENTTIHIFDEEVTDLTKENYRELTCVPEYTIEYWIKANKSNQPLLWFAFMPHIFIKESVETREFEIVELALD